jgi:hypothetical protein
MFYKYSKVNSTNIEHNQTNLKLNAMLPDL